MRHSNRLTPRGYLGDGSAREMVSTLLQLGQTMEESQLVPSDQTFNDSCVAGQYSQVNGILKAVDH